MQSDEQRDIALSSTPHVVIPVWKCATVDDLRRVLARNINLPHKLQLEFPEGGFMPMRRSSLTSTEALFALSFLQVKGIVDWNDKVGDMLHLLNMMEPIVHARAAAVAASQAAALNSDKLWLNRKGRLIPMRHREAIMADLSTELTRLQASGCSTRQIRRLLFWQFFWIALETWPRAAKAILFTGVAGVVKWLVS